MTIAVYVLTFACLALIGLSVWLYQKLFFWKLKSYELQEKLKLSEDGQTQYQDIKENMKESFQALAHQTLEGQTKRFIEMAEQSLSKHTELAKVDLQQRQSNIENVVQPLKDTLSKIQEQTFAMEKERQRSYGVVEAELKKVIETSHMLSAETRSLKNALKKPHVRGRWGEVQLKNCIEIAGMSEYADITMQDMTTLEQGQKLIPDMTVKMPGGRLVVVDAKTPLDGFIASLEATTEEQKNIEMQRHGNQVKEHIRKLAQKSYSELIEGSADFTVMFLPNESFLYAALETQPDLVEYALEKKILIATPPTFIGLLKVIRYGWNEERLAKNAETIWQMGAELHKRIVDYVESYTAVGKHLGHAQAKYDEGLKRLNSRVLVQVRRLEELGVKGRKDLPEDLGFDHSEGLSGETTAPDELAPAEPIKDSEL